MICESCQDADVVYYGINRDGDHVGLCELCYADFGLVQVITVMVK